MSKDPEKKSRLIPSYLEIVFITLAMTTVALFCYDRYFAQKIYVVDFKGYLRTQRSLLAVGKIDEAAWKAHLDNVEQLLDEKSTDSRNVILFGDAVLRNGKRIQLEND